MFTNTYRKCSFGDVILFGVTVCSKFHTKCFTTAACDWKCQRTLKTVTANVISSQTIKRQNHNAQLQQHCCTRSHSSCSNCPPSAAAHARNRFHHFTAPSIMRWSRRSHSSTMRWRSSSTLQFFPCKPSTPTWFTISHSRPGYVLVNIFTFNELWNVFFVKNNYLRSFAVTAMQKYWNMLRISWVMVKYAV